jgi:acyl-CoA thioesterase-1
MSGRIFKFHIFISFFVLLIACSESRKGSEITETATTVEKETQPAMKKPVILFFGNSLTAGYQLDINEAFPALIQERLDSLGYQYEVINAGLSGETTAAGTTRIDWVLRTVPDIFFLELGANDGLRGLPLSETKKNLQTIIDKVRVANPEVQIVIVGMQVPPNLGQEYTDEFQNIFPEIAKKNNATLLPFLLEGVAGNPELNLTDGIHPTAEGHQLMSETVWTQLLPLLSKAN